MFDSAGFPPARPVPWCEPPADTRALAFAAVFAAYVWGALLLHCMILGLRGY